MGHDYLFAIGAYREEGRCIYYLGEAWQDTRDILKKAGTIILITSSKQLLHSRVITSHCGSATDWVEGAALLSAKILEVFP